MRILTLLLALVVTATSSSCGDGSAESSSNVAAPQGTRWVGMSGVVVAVPDWWSTGDIRCGAPVEDTVYFDQAATVDCADPVPDSVTREVSSLAILDGTRGYGEFRTRDMTKVAEASGRDVRELAECEEWFPGVCRRLFAVPDAGVVFAVTIDDPGDGDYDAIRDSVRILPDSQTTVPIHASGWTLPWGAEPATVPQLTEAIQAAGLRVAVVAAESPRRDTAMVADLPEGSYLGSNPEQGSVIDRGGTVRITVMPPRPSGPAR